MKFEIKNRWNGSVLFAHEADGNTIAITLSMALEAQSRLIGAYLRDAYLRDADLSGADLRGADLRGADLRGADLRGADLTPIRDDIWAVLSAAPAEVSALIDALKNGRVDGSTYEGACACLVGTLANARQTHYQNLGTVKPNSSRPAECFFMGIHKGDTPETNQFSRLALEWSQEWLETMRTAFQSAEMRRCMR